MVVYLQSIFFLKFLASCHLHYLIHISEIHAFHSNKSIKKQEFPIVTDRYCSMAVPHSYTPVRGGTAYGTQKAADNPS